MTLRFVRPLARLAIVSLAAAGVLGCERGVSEADPPHDVAGDWAKTDNLLPPMHLRITQTGPAIDVRLSFSGVQMDGTGRVTPNGFSVTFPGRGVDGSPSYLDADLVGDTVLRARYRGQPSGPPAMEATLRRVDFTLP